MCDNEKINRQIRTWRTGEGVRTLTSGIVENLLRPLRSGEILIEVLFVPIHGSFWMATHPAGIHPRHDEFVSDGGFVFGNGGVARVISVAEDCARVQAGDFVSVMGHLPCGNEECRSCRVLRRYTECESGGNMIIGHGKGAPDGTFAQYCILPEIACEVCFSSGKPPSEEELMPYMFAFLFADVRNAMTRDPGILEKQRMLLIGAGYSGHLAAWLLLHHSPRARIIAVDTQEERLKSIQQIAPESISTMVLPQASTGVTGADSGNPWTHGELEEVVQSIENAISEHCGGQKCDLVFDASSGHTTPLWANSRILAPNAYCVVFGFGSDGLFLNKECLQISGLRIFTSRGVGDPDNQRAAVELIRSGASKVIYQGMIRESKRLDGLDQALAFIKEQHQLSGLMNRTPNAFLAPNLYIREQ